ncbi:MAG: PorT family protein [Cytophagaceae bacterium]|nr:PorT family protein [Cytophagaceae bacterium]
MKTNLLFTVGLLLLLTTAQAQEKYGVRAGLNVANMSQAFNSELDNPLPRAAWFAGFTADYSLVKNYVYFQPGLLFSKKGFLLNDPDLNTRSITSLNYFEVPLNVVVKFGKPTSYTKFYLVGGGYGALGLGGKTKVRVNGEKTEQYNVKFDESLKRFDYGVNAGLGFQFGYVQLGVFYQQGLRNLSGDGTSTNARNQVFGVSFGYLFDDLF